jgi:hypothetical protein
MGGNCLCRKERQVDGFLATWSNAQRWIWRVRAGRSVAGVAGNRLRRRDGARNRAVRRSTQAQPTRAAGRSPGPIPDGSPRRPPSPANTIRISGLHLQPSFATGLFNLRPAARYGAAERSELGFFF